MGKTINGTYYTSRELEAIKKAHTDDEFEKFLISGVIGAATGSTIIGGLLGGSFLGGFMGDLLEGDDDSWL
jgi:hypothetical protein